MTPAVFVLASVAVLAVIGVDSKVTYGCYGPPGSHCTKHHLSCDEGEVIGMSVHVGPIAMVKKKNSTSCKPVLQDECDKNKCCKPTEGVKDDVADILPVQDDVKAKIYSQCSNQRSCAISSPFLQNSDYDYVNYYYFCMLGAKVWNITDKMDDSDIRDAFLYFSGMNKPSRHLSCSCHVTSPGKITLQSMFLQLSKSSCERVTIKSQERQLVKCGDDGALEFDKWLDQVKNDIEIKFDDFTAQDDDMIWLQFSPELDVQLNVNCTGCIEGNSGIKLSPTSFLLGITACISTIIPLLITSRHL